MDKPVPVTREYVVHVSAMDSELLEDNVYCAFFAVAELMKQCNLNRYERAKMVKMLEQFNA